MKAWQLVEKGWCQGTYARNKDGQPVKMFSEEAVQFCSVAAIYKIYVQSVDENHARMRLRNIIGGQVISIWNDAPERTQAEVVETLKRADV